MTSNLQRKRAKRNDILQAATKLFFSRGYRQISIADISQEANCSQVTLYKYFSSKEQLAQQVVLSLIVNGYRSYESLLDDDSKNFKQKVHTMMQDADSQSIEMNNDFYDFMIKEFRGQNGNTIVKDRYDELKLGFWHKLLAQGRKERIVSPEITDEGAMIFLEMYIEYFMKSDSASKTRAKLMKKHEKELVQLFFYGLIGE